MESVGQRDRVLSHRDGSIPLSPAVARHLREAFEQMDLLLVGDDPEDGLRCLLALLGELRIVRRAVT